MEVTRCLGGSVGISDEPPRKAVLTMQSFRGIKLLAAGGVFLSLSLGALAFAGNVAALTPSSAVSCSHMVGIDPEDEGVLSKCSSATGASGTISSFSLNGGNIAWHNGTATDYTDSYTNSGTKCPEFTTEYNIKGTVSSSTNGSISDGATVKMTLCLHSDGKTKNAPGTVVKF
jgi:hypothetical protein